MMPWLYRYIVVFNTGLNWGLASDGIGWEWSPLGDNPLLTSRCICLRRCRVLCFRYRLLRLGPSIVICDLYTYFSSVFASAG
jgi:hypothetical protein